MKKKTILCLSALLVLLVVCSVGCRKDEQKHEQTGLIVETEQDETIEEFVEVKYIEFPYESEDGTIKIDSLFQFTGFNPDCGSEEGEDVAGIQLTNISENHLSQAKIVLTLSDETLLEFEVFDVPAERSAMIFSNKNVSIDSVDNCEAITCETSFEGENTLLNDKVQYFVNGTEVTVTNVSGQDLTDVKVYCHSVLEEVYFGGVTYCYEIDSLGVGQSTVVDAFDCIMGETDVVRMDCELQ